MDLDQLNCASDEEMDMFMMMQMDKLSELCGDMTELPSIPYMTTTTTSTADGSSSSSNNNNFSFSNNTPMFHHQSSSNNNNNAAPSSGMMMRGVNGAFSTPSEKRNSMAAMREMIFRIAAMQPIHIDPESVKPPKRRNVKISKDPQSVAARHRRERISERIRILQRLVPGGTKMDTASMLDEAIHYVKFLKTQVQSLERAAGNNNNNRVGGGVGYPLGIVVNNGGGGGGGGGGAYHVPHNVQHYTTNV